MKSILWFTVGVAVGFVVAHQVNKTQQGRDFFSSVDAKAREFGNAIADGYHEREAELRVRPRPPTRRPRTDHSTDFECPDVPGGTQNGTMQTADIRQRWLDFFAERGHTVVPSASLVSDDPTLLFTVAGMVPFVPYLTGLVPAPYPRATSVQKCIRTNDIEEVGKTPRHGTFFQMSGNFSFGDYFKEGAISLRLGAAHHARGRRRLRLRAETTSGSPSTRTTTRPSSSGSASPGLPEERIQRLGKDTNYWHTGQPGPAGPCSEIFFDRGPEYGIDGGPATDDDRYVEIWNLVFMQYLHRRREAARPTSRSSTTCRRRTSTPAWGSSASRSSSRASRTCTRSTRSARSSTAPPSSPAARYGADHDDDVRMRVIADHVRSALMLMSDGVTPSNEGRGYILRRLLRRSVRAMRLLGVEGPTFPELFAASRDAMKTAYPEVASDYARIEQLAFGEEETFLRTLATGTIDPRRRGGRDQAVRPRASSPATPRSCCTTPTGSRSTSPSRWPRRPASPSTAPRSTPS